MLNSIRKLRGCRVFATDGVAGRVRDAYVDDREWIVRWLVVDTRGWLSDRTVLLAPSVVSGVDWHARTIALGITRARVDHSPDTSTHEPVSRQREAQAWPYAAYWPWGAMPVLLPPPVQLNPGKEARTAADQAGPDAHLRSCRVLRGYHIKAMDESIGHAADFLFDDRTWAIRYLIADTRNWLPGKHVLIAPQRIHEVSWSNRELRVSLTRRQIEGSPEYDAEHLPA